MPRFFTLALSLLPWIPGFLCRITTTGEYKVLEGESLVIPCQYEPQYASYVKYLCRGKTRELCSSVARTDNTHPANPAEDKVSIFDDPVQLVVTVTMNNLKEADSGWYMCGVEIGGLWSRDAVTYAHVEVIHGLSVVNNHLSGEEGSSVTVECVYSERHRESEKKWCRSGDWSSCLSTGSERSYEDTSVAISDDRIRAFTVTLKKLQLSDTSWYFCLAGQQQILVHILVTPRATTTAVSVTSPLTASHSEAHLPPTKSISKSSWNNHSHILESLLVCGAVMLIVGMAILVRRLWRLRHPQYPHLVQAPMLRQVEENKTMINKYCLDEGDPKNIVLFKDKDSQDGHM